MQIPRLLLKPIDQIPLESQAQGLAFFTMSPEVSWTVKLENQYFCFVLFLKTSISKPVHQWFSIGHDFSLGVVWRHYWLSWLWKGSLYLVAWGQRHCSTSPSAQHSTPQWRMIWPQMSIGLRLRNPGLGSVVNTWRGLKSGCVTGWFLTLLRWGAEMGLWTSMSRNGAAKFSWNWAELTSTESIQMIGWKLLVDWFAKVFFFFSPLIPIFFYLLNYSHKIFATSLGKSFAQLVLVIFLFHPKDRVTLRPYWLRIEKRSCL